MWLYVSDTNWGLIRRRTRTQLWDSFLINKKGASRVNVLYVVRWLQCRYANCKRKNSEKRNYFLLNEESVYLEKPIKAISNTKF